MRALFAALIIAATPAVALAQSTAPTNKPGASPEAVRPGDAQPGAKARPDAGKSDAGKPDSRKPDTAKSDKPAGKPLEAAQEPDRGKRLDALFAALKIAPDKASAKSIAERIDVALTPTGSDTADLLLNRAGQALEAKDYDLAIELLDGALKVAPDHLDAWNKRATVFYLKQDFSDALADLRQVVAREPRHYGAWAGISIICKEIGDEKHALEAARQALGIYPHLDEVEDMEKTLSVTVEGRPI